MKTIYKSSLLLLAAILFLPAAIQVQGQTTDLPYFKLNKTITRDQNDNNKFTIRMEAYVTQSSSTTVTYDKKVGADIVLVLDASSQMSNPIYETTVTYTPVTSNYSVVYSNRNNTTYYYKDGDNYYQVTNVGRNGWNYNYTYSITYNNKTIPDLTGTAQNLYTRSETQTPKYTYTAESRKTYLQWYNDRDNGPYYYKDGDDYYQVTITRTGNQYNYNYSISYTKGGNNVALGSVNYNNRNNNFPYTLYTRTAMTKLSEEQAAAVAFIEALEQNAIDEGVDHNVSIVKYAGNYYGTNGETNIDEGNNNGSTQVVRNFNAIGGNSSSQTNKNTLTNSINAIVASGTPSRADYGMRKAQVLLYQDDVKNDGRPKVVVFFSGGVPSSTTSGTASLTQSVVSTALSYSAGMKNNNRYGNNNSTNPYGSNVTVFSVGLLDGITVNTNLTNFLTGISSNYPNASCASNYNWNWNLGTGSDQGYYQNGTETPIFSMVTNKVNNLTTTVRLTETKDIDQDVHIIDFLSEDFRLPKGTTVSDITVQQQKANDRSGSSGNYTYTIGGATSAAPNTVRTSVDVVNGKVEVYGYDFNANAVSRRYNTYNGNALVITFTVEIDPSSEGGMGVASNTDASGAYIGDANLKAFNVPTADIPNIIISKKGLKEGESALFNVSMRTGGGGLPGYTYGDPIQVWVTGDGNETVTTKVKFLRPGTYKVEETAWSWAYTRGALQEKTVGGTTNSPEDNTTFEFTNTPTTGTPAHGEAATDNNVFSK